MADPAKILELAIRQHVIARKGREHYGVELPVGGWEREVSAKIRSGEDPGWRGRGFVPRFGAALDACGGRSL